MNSDRELVFRNEAAKARFGKLGADKQRRLVRRAENRVGGGVLERIERCASVEELVGIEEAVAGCTRMSEGTRRKVVRAVARRIGELRVGGRVPA